MLLYIASPLTDLLKKDCFNWSFTAHEAFSKLKNASTCSKITRFYIAIHIGDKCLWNRHRSSYLNQCSYPIAYFSKKLSSAMQKQSNYMRRIVCNNRSYGKILILLNGA